MFPHWDVVTVNTSIRFRQKTKDVNELQRIMKQDCLKVLSLVEASSSDSDVISLLPEREWVPDTIFMDLRSKSRCI